MKVGYNVGDGALRSGKIKVRWRLDTSKIEGSMSTKQEKFNSEN